ncbi:MAG: hypothetical protein ACOC6U_01040 [Thermoplasmatota archaeon]
MSLKISDKNRPRLTLIVIFLIFVSITAYSLNNAESKQKITVDEGYEKIKMKHYNGEDLGIVYGDILNTTAVTTIDKQSSLELKVVPRSITVNNDYHQINIEIYTEGDFSSKHEIKVFKFTAAEKKKSEKPYNHLNYYLSSTGIDNGNMWSAEDQSQGVVAVGPDKIAFVGFDLISKKFSTSTELSWRIPVENIGNNYTLELKGVVKGLSEDVTVTIDIDMEGVMYDE